MGCMDDTLSGYSLKGRRLWSLSLPASLTCVELLHHRPRSFTAVVVALQNREVRIYKDKFLVNCITTDVRSLPPHHLSEVSPPLSPGCGGGSKVWSVWERGWSSPDGDPGGSPGR